MSGAHDGFMRRLTRTLGGYWKRRLWQRGLRESLAADTWTAEQCAAFHDAQLVRLVRGAVARVPFYQRLYREAGVDVAAFRGARDLPRLPTISKRDLLEHGAEMLRPIHPLRVHHSTTGGSTGTIATVVTPRGLSEYESGCIYALWSRIGVRHGDRMALLRGALLDDGRQRFLHEPQLNRLTVSTYHLRDDNVDEVLAELDRFRPAWLHVYPSAATLMANILQRTGRKLGCTPRGVLCGSEGVADWQVTLFRAAFGCRTYAHYGHGETAILGGWCDGSQAYHFLPNHGYLELLDDQHQPVTVPDVTGEMTGTGYLNDVMPLIRYRTGDYGAWDTPGPCKACGRQHQRVARIEGRIQEYLILADGTRFPLTNINALHGTFFSLIYKFQFVQDVPGQAALRIVPAGALTPAHRAEIEQAFAYLPALGLQLTLQPVPEIRTTRSGKQRVVVTSEYLAREAASALQPSTSGGSN